MKPGMFILLVAALLVASPSFATKLEFRDNPDSVDPILEYFQELEAGRLAETANIQLSLPAVPKPENVCYAELGCFYKKGTFKHLRQLPDPPEKVNTTFLLYTKKNPMYPQVIDYKDPETIINSNFNVKLPIKVLAPGFGGKPNMTWLWDMKNAFLKMEDVNVIVIDWSLGGAMPYYITASVNSELIGAQVANLFFTMKDKLGAKEEDLHILGYSLGAHLGGFVGKRMKMLRGTKPGRITGLDPCSPLFESYGGNVHLYKDDADLVDIIHTNADRAIYGGIGMWNPIGHMDFYPNGGKRQPGCKSTIKGAILDIFKGEEELACNHERAVQIYMDSILNADSCQHVGYPCSNYSDFQQGKCLSCDESICGQMGHQPKGSGIYYLLTKATKPYCADAAKLHVRYQSDVKKSFGSIILTFIGANGEQENITVSGKDEKLSPGGEKAFALPVNDVLKPLSKVMALYMRYNGWFTSGTETFNLASITLTNTKGDYIFKNCGEGIILKHNVYQELKQTDGTC